MREWNGIFWCFGRQIAVLFSQNQVTDQSSDLSDTADHCLNYYGMFFVWYVRTLSFKTDRIQKFVYIFCEWKMADILHVKNRALMLKAVLRYKAVFG